MPARLPTIAALADPDALGAVLEARVLSIARLGAHGLGYSFTGNRLERLEARLADGRVRRLVMKITAPAENWIARRTGDAVGREARVLAEPALAPIWDVYASPYLAYAFGDREVGVLMDDLTPWLLPDDREPLAEAAEDRLVGALAALHARFWARPPELTWAVTPTQRFGLFHPRQLDDDAPVFELARQGWPAALARLPRRLADLLTRPPDVLAQECGDLPSTVLHGDCKVANFGLVLDSQVAAFDWEGLVVGPAPLELGYYLAVNAPRIVDAKEALIGRYRRHLESALDTPIDASTWRSFEALTVLAGANLLLWQKALPLVELSAPPGRVAELDWWIAALDRYW